MTETECRLTQNVTESNEVTNGEAALAFMAIVGATVWWVAIIATGVAIGMWMVR